jgi:hypothetical protein
MRLRDLDPEALAEQAHRHVVERLEILSFGVGYFSEPSTVPRSLVREAVAALATYARGGATPADARGALLHLAAVGLIPASLDPEEPASDASEAVLGVHLVVLAVLAREALRGGQAPTATQLAALGSVSSAAIRQHLGSGELRRWRAGPARGDRRAYVHPEDARRWLAARGVEA